MFFQGAPSSKYRTACLENRPELLTTEIAKEVIETITDNEVEEVIEGGEVIEEVELGGEEAEEVSLEYDMTPISDDGDEILEGINLHKVLDKEEGVHVTNEEEDKGFVEDVQVGCNTQNELLLEEGEREMKEVNVEKLEDTKDTLDGRGGDSEKYLDNERIVKEGTNSDASSNDRSSSYMIVILPPGESSSVNTTQGSSSMSQGSEADEEEDEDVVSTDLGYPKTETPSVNTISPGASPLRRVMSGDIPDAAESAVEYEAGDEAVPGNYFVGQKKIIGISSVASSEELSLELDEGIVGDQEGHKGESQDIFPKVSRSFKTSTPLRTDEMRSPIEEAFKTPRRLDEELKVPGRLEDELRLTNSVETGVKTPHNKVAAYLQSLPYPSEKVDTAMDNLCDKSSNGEVEERQVEVFREGLLDRSLDSDPAVSQASGSRTSRQSDLGSLTGRYCLLSTTKFIPYLMDREMCVCVFVRGASL